jgi:purine nucleosidase
MPLRAVLDTDTFNEVDDQFALAHLLLSPDTVALEAVYAAPFYYPKWNDRSTSPAEGMEKSYEEILRVLALVGRQPSGGVFRGSTAFLPGPATPVDSPAARDLIERALSGEPPLHVVAIGAITNVASALLLEPRIAERIRIVWLGGHAYYWPSTLEFNLVQDLHASRVILEQPVPFVQVPCAPVTSHLTTTVPELEKHLAPFSRLGRYLTDIVRDYSKGRPVWSKEIWDLAGSAYVVNPQWFKVRSIPAPVLLDDVTWAHAPHRRTIEFVHELNRDAIFADFFAKARQLGLEN